MRLTTYHTTDGFEELSGSWNDLLRRSYNDRIFSTYEWQRTWWDIYQPGELMLIAAHDDEEQLIGIAPWFIETKDDERILRGIGCVDVTDYVDLIVDQAHLEIVCRMFARSLTDAQEQYTRVMLCNIPENSPTLAVFASALKSEGFEVQTAMQEVCPVIRLPQDFETYIESLEKKQRHELRRKLRRAEGSDSDMTWYQVNISHDLNHEINAFISLMAASQPAKAEFLSDPQNDKFIRAIAQVTFDRGWLQLSFLLVDGEACAAYMNFDYRDEIQVYNSGLLPDKYGHLSPGIILLAHNIKTAIDTGHHTFDFLRGNEAYKYRMGAVDRGVFQLSAKLMRVGKEQ